jgi:hypothetical protein
VEEVQQGDPRAPVRRAHHLDRRLGRAENLPVRFRPSTRLASVRLRSMPSKSVASTTAGLVVAALYLATTTVIAIRWLDVGENDARSMNHFFATRFVDMVEGRAYRPFVTRALVPGTIRVLRDTLPLRWQTAMQGAVVRTLHLRRHMAGLGWEPEYAFEYVAFGVITLAAFACVPFALRAAFRASFVTNRLWADMLPLPLLLLLEPAFFGRARNMYDPATLALFALGTWSVLARRAGTFYVIYALAVLNKETALLLGALFLIARARDWRTHLLPVVGLWLAARLWLGWAFRENPGGAEGWVPMRSMRNLAQALSAPWSVVPLMVALAALAWGVWQWRSIRTVRIGAPVLVGALLPAYLVAGCWGEYRVFYDVVPLAWITVYAAIARLLGVAIEPAKEDAN